MQNFLCHSLFQSIQSVFNCRGKDINSSCRIDQSSLGLIIQFFILPRPALGYDALGGEEADTEVEEAQEEEDKEEQLGVEIGTETGTEI